MMWRGETTFYALWCFGHWTLSWSSPFITKEYWLKRLKDTDGLRENLHTQRCLINCDKSTTHSLSSWWGVCVLYEVTVVTLQLTTCVCLCECMCVFDVALVTLAPADLGLSGPLSSLSPSLGSSARVWLSCSWFGLVCLYEFRHAQWHLVCFSRQLA